jgi:hypothetical protein
MNENHIFGDEKFAKNVIEADPKDIQNQGKGQVSKYAIGNIFIVNFFMEKFQFQDLF